MPMREGDDRNPEVIERGLEVRRGAAVHREVEEDRERKDADIRRRARALDLIDAIGPRESARTEGAVDPDGIPGSFVLHVFRRKAHRDATGTDGTVDAPVVEIMSAMQGKWHDRLTDRIFRPAIIAGLRRMKGLLRQIADGKDPDKVMVDDGDMADEITILRQSAKSVATRLLIRAVELREAELPHAPDSFSEVLKPIIAFLVVEADMLRERYAHGCPRRETGLACMLESATSRYHGGDDEAEILRDFGYGKMAEAEKIVALGKAAGKAHAEYHRAASHAGNFRDCNKDVCHDLHEALGL